MGDSEVRTKTGRALDELTIEAVLNGELGVGDFGISAEQLRMQAAASEEAGYRQLAENLRRAAELTAISNDQILALYTALRPGRSSHEELLALADRLEREHAAPLTAELVREAAEAYRARGIGSRS